MGSTHDSWVGRVHYLASLGGGKAAEARHSARRNVSSRAVRELPVQLREALVHWRQYRRAIAERSAN